jgi:hypothetical protein
MAMMLVVGSENPTQRHHDIDERDACDELKIEDEKLKNQCVTSVAASP